jgi:hypothetical protein
MPSGNCAFALSRRCPDAMIRNSDLRIPIANRGTMSGRPAIVRQRDVKQIIGAAKRAGAKDVTVKIGEVSLTINLADEKPIAAETDEEVTL